MLKRAIEWNVGYRKFCSKAKVHTYIASLKRAKLLRVLPYNNNNAFSELLHQEWAISMHARPGEIFSMVTAHCQVHV